MDVPDFKSMATWNRTERGRLKRVNCNACRVTMSIASFLLILSSAFYFAAKVVSHKQADNRRHDPPEDALAAEECREPLMAETP
jgi:hypothetical protein